MLRYHRADPGAGCPVAAGQFVYRATVGPYQAFKCALVCFHSMLSLPEARALESYGPGGGRRGSSQHARRVGLPAHPVAVMIQAPR